MKVLKQLWTRSARRLVTLAAAMTMVGGVPARAQSGVDVAAGYLNAGGTMHGGFGQVSVDLGRHWSIFGQIDATRGRELGDETATFRDVAVLGGVRHRWQPTPRVSPFWQVSLGVLHSEGTADYVNILGRHVHETFTVNYRAIQPGGGVTVMVTPRVGLRGQLDVLLAIPDQSRFEGGSAFVRPAIGGVVRFGAGP